MTPPMSTFRPVNTGLSVPEGSGSKMEEVNTPTTPKPNAWFAEQPPKEISREESGPTTPTRYNFGGLPGQKPLPDSPFTPSHRDGTQHHPDPTLSRENSHRSVQSHQSADSQDQDVDMADDDDEQDGSDNDSVASDSQRPSKKKKKGQRFFCTDFPPCTLSFTRSEHLARHIRKHTGERPFQCHCSRRFSRLDNLRQHAQTVHVNEEIPAESLAATGTRFQRQIRTDRVRPPAGRSRASTMTSQGGHSRGHSRNLSASSVTSTGSSVAGAEDSRRRPQPLAMAQDGSARARLTLDTFNPAIGSPGTQYGYYNPQSPSGHSTPTSATFSTDTGSPRFSSGVQSPSALSRSSYYNGSRTPGRRLSVPSGAHPFQMHQGGPIYPPPPAVFFSPMASSTASNFSPGSSVFANPTSSVFSQGRRDSDADLEYRRRTWHPGTYAGYVARPATSGLTYHSTPDDTRPALAAQPAASQVTRLPGIESFDHAPPPPAPQRQLSSPMQVESRQPVYSGPMDSSAPGPDDRRAHPGWEAGLHQNLTKLEIANATPPKEGQNWIEHARLQHGSSHQRSISASSSSYPQQQMYVVAPNSTPSVAMDPSRADQPRQNKRKAWYGGPVGAPQPPTGSQPIMIAQPRTSPEDSGSSDGVPTPSTSQGHELHPAILHANGMIEMQPPGTTLTEEQQKTVQAYAKPTPTRADSGFQSYVSGSTPGLSQGHIPVMQAGRDIHLQPFSQPPPARPANDMGRLEALVAVATSENRAVEHRT